eukprot:3281188-Amphidinium_carterae.1
MDGGTEGTYVEYQVRAKSKNALEVLQVWKFKRSLRSGVAGSLTTPPRVSRSPHLKCMCFCAQHFQPYLRSTLFEKLTYVSPHLN